MKAYQTFYTCPCSRYIHDNLFVMQHLCLSKNILYFQTTQQYYTANPADITMAQFLKSFFVLACDTSPASYNQDQSLPLLTSGSLRLKMTFSQNTRKCYNVLVFGVLPSALSIDKHKVVKLSECY